MKVEHFPIRMKGEFDGNTHPDFSSHSAQLLSYNHLLLLLLLLSITVALVHAISRL